MKKKLFVFLLLLMLCISLVFTFCGCENLGSEIGEITITIECKTILNNMDKVEQGLIDNNMIPNDGIILAPIKIKIYEKDNGYTILKRVCSQKNIHLDCSYEPVFGTYYIKGINHIYEMSVGESSGWMYYVDGEYPDCGVSLYKFKGGESVRFSYTCSPGDNLQ